jgi:hypothetical protein
VLGDVAVGQPLGRPGEPRIDDQLAQLLEVDPLKKFSQAISAD